MRLKELLDAGIIQPESAVVITVNQEDGDIYEEFKTCYYKRDCHHIDVALLSMKIDAVRPIIYHNPNYDLHEYPGIEIILKENEAEDE